MKFTKAALAIALVAVAAIKGTDAATLCGVTCGKADPACHCRRAKACLTELLAGNTKFNADAQKSFSPPKNDYKECPNNGEEIGRLAYNAALSGNAFVHNAAATLNNHFINSAVQQGEDLKKKRAHDAAVTKAKKDAEQAAAVAKAKKDEEDRLAAEQAAAAAEEARLQALAAEEARLDAAALAVHKEALKAVFAEDAFAAQRAYEHEKAVAIKLEELIAKAPQWITANAEDVQFESKPPSHWYNGQVSKVGETFVFPFIKVEGVNAKGDLILTFPAGSGLSNDGKVHEFGEMTVKDGWVKIKDANFVYTEDPAVVAARAAEIAAAQKEAELAALKEAKLAAVSETESIVDADDSEQYEADEFDVDRA